MPNKKRIQVKKKNVGDLQFLIMDLASRKGKQQLDTLGMHCHETKQEKNTCFRWKTKFEEPRRMMP